MICKDRTRLFLLLLLVFFVLAGCAVNPVTGQQQLMLMSEQDESRLGKATDKSVVEQYGVYESDLLQDYLQGMGRSMALQSHRPTLDWQFKVMDSPVLNAFAAPGGYIYITRGLLASINNEAELAGVIGHEIGHVTARHSAQQYSSKMLANLGLSLGQGLLGGYGEALNPLLKTGAGMLFLKFSRDDEHESDALGVEYATRAGYDATRMAGFFVTLQRQSTLNGKEGDRLPEFFSTHPNPVNREENVKIMAKERQAKAPGQAFRVNREAYLSKIDGLVYGDDPRKGFIEEGWYYLPQFKLKLPIPEGWKTNRGGLDLQMVQPEKKAVVLFSVHEQANAREVAGEFFKSTGAVVHRQQQVTNSDGMPATVVSSVLGSGKKQALLMSSFFQVGADTFAFHAMSDQAGHASFSAQIKSPSTGFSILRDREKINRQPKKIAIRRVHRGATVKNTLKSMKVPSELWEEVAWLNGWMLSDLLPAGEQIKVLK